jgi:hypothetical protein
MIIESNSQITLYTKFTVRIHKARFSTESYVE